MQPILILILYLSLTSPAGAVWPLALTWGGISQAAVFLAQQVGVEYLAEYLQNTLQPKDLEKVQNSIAELKAQVQQAQNNNIPEAEVQKIQILLANTEQLARAMAKQMHKQITDLNSTKERLAQDVALLQNELVQLRTQLHTVGANLEPPVTSQTSGINLPIQVNYTYRRNDTQQQLPLTEGTQLSAKDRYKITFTPERDAWVYIFQVDATGKIFQLFPLVEMGGVVVNQTNPVAAGITRSVPSANQSFYLDDSVGTETLYFIASSHQDLALEAQYKDYQQALQAAKPPEVSVAQAGLERTILFARGPVGIATDPAKPQQQVQVTDESGTKPMSADYLNGICGQVGSCINMLRFQHVK